MEQTTPAGVTHDAALRSALDAHRAAVEQFVNAATAVSEEVWSVPREEGKWSPAQESAHIALTYRSYTVELRDGPAVTPDTFAPRMPEMRTRLLPRILAGGFFPVGGVSPSVARPGESLAAQSQVVADIAEQARAFEDTVLAAAEKTDGRFVRHPYFGALTLHELVRVMTEHTLHHGRRLPAVLPGPANTPPP